MKRRYASSWQFWAGIEPADRSWYTGIGLDPEPDDHGQFATQRL